MKASKARLLLCFFQFSVLFAYSQSPLSSYTFNLKYHYGFVLQHSKNMAHLANQRPMGFEADIYKITSGNKKWQQIHNYPTIGYSFQYFHMDRNKPLGDSYSLIIYYGKNFLKTRKSFFTYRMGIGSAYIHKRFDRLTNYKNNLVSSHFNFTLNVRLNYTFRINDYWNINAGVGLIHFSNGATKVPNLGINIPTVHIGFGFTPTMEEKRKDSLPIFKRQTQWMTSLAGGFKQIYPVDGPSYFISTLSTYINRKVNAKSGLSLGLDIFFDKSYKDKVDSVGNKNIQYFRAGLTAGHEFYINKVSLLTQFGAYIYDPFKENKPVYQRLALKFYFKENLFGIIGLKTHFGQAEFVEWGAGVKF